LNPAPVLIKKEKGEQTVHNREANKIISIRVHVELGLDKVRKGEIVKIIVLS